MTIWLPCLKSGQFECHLSGGFSGVKAHIFVASHDDTQDMVVPAGFRMASQAGGS